ncbi:IclR family transcriptional regulator [Novosphingobium sp. TH158]|uniref:IclR family transcriptional regulator n=1 Tax=Novosphingobium sp. TH158 TaxID=2067455 RepID=UPI000C7CC1DB|nr:helix-turn-helix domain-containing protein [Novosphingobium sp. TH158]PLK26956.1 transcriptional regulator [Novosphingobium sp. TH158]
MTRTSPGVKRIAAILDFLADHPTQSFALTDLVRALKLSRATAHALLTGLVEVGYLYRTTDKTYVLGPALARVGRAAAQNMSPLQVAQPEMRALADEFDVVCSAFFLEGDTIVSRERAASISHVGYSLPLGTRIRLMPRSLPTFFAWDADEARARMDRAETPVTPAAREQIEAAMAFMREHGFGVMMRTDDPGRNPDSLEAFGGEADRPVAILGAITGDETYVVSAIVAPVFNAQGRIEFVLSLMGFSRAMTGTQVFAAAGSLLAACKRIGAFIG